MRQAKPPANLGKCGITLQSLSVAIRRDLLRSNPVVGDLVYLPSYSGQEFHEVFRNFCRPKISGKLRSLLLLLENVFLNIACSSVNGPGTSGSVPKQRSDVVQIEHWEEVQPNANREFTKLYTLFVHFSESLFEVHTHNLPSNCEIIRGLVRAQCLPHPKLWVGTKF